MHLPTLPSHWQVRILSTTLFVVIGMTLFVNRAMFTYQFSDDREYLHNLYDHSQWTIPQSTRVISDNQLYQVAADRLLRGDSIYSINPEVPPLGKYIYALGISLTNSPYSMSFLLYGIALLLMYGITRIRHFQVPEQLFALTVLASSPLFFSQLTQTMLDLPQVVFVLMHLLFLCMAWEKKAEKHELLFTALAGGMLGLAAATKFPIFIALLAAYTVVFITYKRSVVYGSVFGAMTALGYALPFIPTLLQSGVGQVASAQKWMIMFYTNQYNSVLVVDNLRHFLLGRFISTTGSEEHALEWTPLLPVLLIFVVLSIWKYQKKLFRRSTSDIECIYISGAFCTLLITIVSVTVYTRYFLLLLPFGIFLFAHWYRSKLHTIATTFVLILSISALVYQRPNPQVTLQFAELDWQQGNYQDFYSHLVPTSIELDRWEFLARLKQIEFATETSEQEFAIEKKSVSPLANTAEVLVVVSRTTPMGNITRTIPITVERIQGAWKIHWNWEIISPLMTAETQLELAKPTLPAPVLTADGKQVAYSKEVPYFELIPAHITDKATFISALDATTEASSVALEKLLYVTGVTRERIPFLQVPSGFNWDDIPSNDRAALAVVNKLERTYDPQLSERGRAAVLAFENEHRAALGLTTALVRIEPDNTQVVLSGTFPERGTPQTMQESYADLVSERR